MNSEFPTLQNSSLYQRTSSGNPWKLPLKVIKLFLLCILIPCFLIGMPLYLRFRVYNHQLYPLAMSDMRLIDNKVSTTWCQRQKVSVNATFNAFLLSNTPEMSEHKKPMSMIRELDLEDDTKEYWGFYLLKGTSVTVSTCVRWPGASLIMIRGHKHLHECAYIGDNSSEELEEQMEAIREHAIVESDEKKADQPANIPEAMKRHRPEVEFHTTYHQNKSLALEKSVENIEITDMKDMRKILLALQERTEVYKSKTSPNHVHRNSTVAQGETYNFKFNKPKNVTSSEEAMNDILSKLTRMGEKGQQVLDRVNSKYNKQNKSNVFQIKSRHYSKPIVNFSDDIDRSRKRRKRELIISQALANNEDDRDNDFGMEEEEFHPDGIADHRGSFNETSLNDMSNSEFWSSFSSSEEALLNCAGLILNLPLLPHRKCVRDTVDEESSRDNTITYKVPVNGYYFFVFNSENEVQTNYVRVKFDIEKTVYNVSNSVSKCINVSESCSLDLTFFSHQKLVLELPLQNNETLWNEEFVVLSECEPRGAIYAIFVILVPIIFIFFAFS
ncbi:uncharacterized protein LOC130444560 isoform X2 [Diorhabda sublineata]|uniref:uncharacterized protein LOC130444560 isoform X2 n=1 Tax=Diorhabda sublineata TaxID=1163346 RepID=UPI0024E05FA0|nr:uncharacterized protein LOC130444560 isoform X2 [Diorhabda sublineata]